MISDREKFKIATKIKSPYLSIIMPALNEEENILLAIGNSLKTFDDLNIDGELIVVNDGSTDGTRNRVKKIISERKDNRIHLVNHSTPCGIGVSFWDGVSNAKGEVLCMLPADNENDAYEILRYLELMRDVDIIIPFVYNKEIRPLFRNIFTSICKTVINATFGVCFIYTNGTVLYRKSILNELDSRSHSFFFQVDILVRLVKRGYLFAEVPYRLGMRTTGRSKVFRCTNCLQAIKEYFILARDIYFRRKTKLVKRRFSEDSISRQRYIL